MKLTLIIATRDRPGLLLHTMRETLPNIGRDDTRVLICADDDDELTLEALKLLPRDDRITASVKPREDSRGEKYDRALEEAAADIYLPAVDYAPILTPAFDQAIINAAHIWPDQIGVVYTPLVDEIIPGLQAITAPLVDKLGGIYNREYPFWFIDHELADIACMIGRVNIADVTVDASRRPEKTHRLRDLEFWTRYYDWMTMERSGRACAIIEADDFESPDWLKAQLLNSVHLIEKRSLVRNAGVRAQAGIIEMQRGVGGEPDPGYVRSKTQAEARLLRLAAFLEQQAAAAA